MKKIVSFLGVIAMMALTFGVYPAMAAGGITAITYTPSGSVVSTFIQPSTTLGVFTPTVAIVVTNTITFTLPAGTVITEGNVAVGDFTIQQAANGGVAGVATAPTAVTPNAAARTLVLTVAAASLSTGAGAGTGVVTVAMSGGATGNEIQNPAVANSGLSFTIITTTNDTPGTIATVVFNPAAITDLSCQGANQAGAVYLLWTVPAGTSVGYTIHYSSGAITTDNLFNAATDYVNTFGPGTPTQSSGSIALIGLAPAATYFFNVKALGLGTSASAISNANIVCRVGATASSVTTVASKPVSSVVSPVGQSSVQAEANVTIRGTSSDSAASSAKQVEVSTDGGTTWALAKPTVSNTSNGFDWTYLWTAPAEGPHLIKTRATNWLGVVETPGAGITVTVAPKAGIIYVPESQATPAQKTATIISAMPYANAVGATQIQADITYLQQQIIILLQQLLQFLTAGM